MRFKINIDDVKETRENEKNKKPPKNNDKNNYDLDDFIFKDEHIKYHSER